MLCIRPLRSPNKIDPDRNLCIFHCGDTLADPQNSHNWCIKHRMDQSIFCRSCGISRKGKIVCYCRIRLDTFCNIDLYNLYGKVKVKILASFLNFIAGNALLDIRYMNQILMRYCLYYSVYILRPL